MSDQERALAHSAINQARALQREIQGFKNLYAAMDRRMREIEERTSDDPGASDGVSGAALAEWQVAADNRLAVLEDSVRWAVKEIGRFQAMNERLDAMSERLDATQAVAFKVPLSDVQNPAPAEDVPEWTNAEPVVISDQSGIQRLASTETALAMAEQSVFPKHIEGTRGRGTRYRLSDGTSVQCSHAVAKQKQAALDGIQPAGEPEAAE